MKYTFPLKHGTRQGCSCSSFIQYLTGGIVIRHEKEIKGINFRKN